MAMADSLIDALNSLPASVCTRQEWIQVGMALKQEGYSCSVWDNWSRSDSRYHEGECGKKWEGFRGSASPVAAGTIVQLAKEHGWNPTGYDKDKIFGWDDYIEYDGFDTPHLPAAWDPVKDLEDYIRVLFRENEIIGYVTQDAYERDGKWIPSGKGIYSMTAGQILKSLDKYRGDPDCIGMAMGDCKPGAGAWIRFNPLDGGGVGNANVTRFDYALVESDTIDIHEQEYKFRQLELPIACMVHSGGKSIHCIVKVNAPDIDEYRKRVAYLYDYLQKQGIEIDKQNSNPSRLSRMPGVMRGDKRQYLIATNIGRKNWEDWIDYVEGEDSELPGIVSFEDIKDMEIVLKPELISGALSQGHKMILTAASKAGKSYMMVELLVSLAEGRDWLGFPCRQSRVLYCNFEIEDSSFHKRVKDVYAAMGIDLKTTRNAGNIQIWNLRGHAMGMDRFSKLLIRKVLKDGRYGAVIIDPIYKVQNGDENDARAISDFCNSVDYVAQSTGCSVIYVHHHSKGDKSGVKAIDRGSGSGVFARDADAIFDVREVDISEAEREQAGIGDEPAFELSTVLREFRNTPNKYIWFDYPLHVEDSTGIIRNHCRRPDGTGSTEAAERGKAGAAAARRAEMENAYDLLLADNEFTGKGPVTCDQMADYFGGRTGFGRSSCSKFLQSKC